MHQNDEREAIGKAGEDSIVFKNPKVEEASSSSLPRSENDLTKLSGAHEPEGQSIGDHHHHHFEDDIDNSTDHLESEGVGEDLDYKELLPGKRPHSVFICPSCNENPVYQKLSMPHNCPHGAKDKPNETYGRLIGLEQGSRESVYAIPTRTAEEPAAEVRTLLKRQDTFSLSRHFYWKRSTKSTCSKCTAKRTRPISSHLDRTSSVNKGFIIWLLGKFFLRDKAVANHSAGFDSSCPLAELAI